jgi:hypothetical protein
MSTDVSVHSGPGLEIGIGGKMGVAERAKAEFMSALCGY